jgi:hypothetical protein
MVLFDWRSVDWNKVNLHFLTNEFPLSTKGVLREKRLRIFFENDGANLHFDGRLWLTCFSIKGICYVKFSIDHSNSALPINN